MNQPIKRRALVLAVLALAALTAVTVRCSLGSSVPGTLLVYYYWSPATINGATSVEAAGVEFGRYDHVVLGEGLESPTHPGHDETTAIIELLDGTEVWGYVNLAASAENAPLSEIESRVAAWHSTGADGVFFDAAGADFGVTPGRLDTAIGYAHNLGMPVIVNAWSPQDVADHLEDGDYYFSESFVVKEGRVDPTWRQKAELVASLGLDTLAVTSNSASDRFDAAAWKEAVAAATEFGYDAIGWGEYLFSADDGSAPWRPRAPER